jgi:hypothetical protein
MPLDAYAEADAQLVIANAAMYLIHRCMTDKGFDTPYRPIDPSRQAPLGGTDQQGYGLPAAHPSGSGYGLPDRAADVARLQGMLEAEQQSQTPAYRKAFYGTETVPPVGQPGPDACVNADAALHSTTKGVDLDLVASLAGQARASTLTDSRIRRLTTEWSTCMAAAGFRYADPRAPFAVAWPHPASSEEIATATADVACKQQTGLVSTWQQVEAGYQQVLIDRNRQALEGVRQAQSELVRRAHQLTGDSPS